MRAGLYRVWFLLLLLSTAAGAAGHRLENQRQRFLDASSALDAGHTARFRQLEAQLKDYPLYPYLRYQALRRNLNHATDKQVRAFLTAYADTPLAERLRRPWLYHLAHRRQWKRFLRFYQGRQSTTLRCYALQARLHTGRTRGLMDAALDLWLVGHSQPKACDPVFSELYASPRMTTEALWKRVRLAIDAGNVSLAGYLAKRLGPRDRHWVHLWERAHRRPAGTLESAALHKDVAVARDIVIYGIGRLARIDADGARQVWDRVRGYYHFPAAEAARVKRTLALHAAAQHQPQARAWLARVPARAVDAKVRRWRVRAALEARDWSGVLHWIAALNPRERREDIWRYWKGRALARTGHSKEARRVMGPLARERTYHGFLAADYMGWSYAMNDQPIHYTGAELQGLLRRDKALLRARELYKVGRVLDARREWRYGTRGLNARDLQLAAVLAGRWGWHDRAIHTVARSGELDDLALRFPLPYRRHIVRTARHFGLSPSWIFGVVRQESAFMEDARSPAGALGLMQLMPSTGRHTARLLNRPAPDRYTLLEAGENVRLGAAYLKRVLDRFSGNMVLATAAYNAGPQRVQSWLPDGHSEPADLWVDLIPYRETRGYVRGVLAFTTVFDWRRQKPVTPLDRRMPPIPAAGGAPGSP